MENLILAMEQSEKLRMVSGGLSEFNPDEKRQLILELLDDHLRTMFVTPKDIDETIKRISFTWLVYTSPSPRELSTSRMPSSA